MDRQRLGLHASLGAAVVFWGLAFVAIKVALEHMAWTTLTILRLGLASLLYLGYLAAARPKPRLRRKDLPMVSALGFLGFTGYHLLLNLGEEDPLTTAGTSALVIASVPAFVSVFAVWHLRERLPRVRVAGLALAFAGLAVMLLLAAPGSEFRVSLTVGAALIVPAAAFAALYTVLAKPYLRTYGAYQLTAYATLLGTLFSLPVAAVDATRFSADLAALTWDGLAPVLFLVIFPTFLAYGIWFQALGRMEASAVGAYVYLSTLLALVAGILFLSEPVTIVALLGGGFVIAGVYLAERKGPGPNPSGP